MNVNNTDLIKENVVFITVSMFLLIFGTSYDFLRRIRTHLDSGQVRARGGISPFAYFMVFIVLISILLLFFALRKRHFPIIIFLPTLFVFLGLISTIMGGNYSLSQLPFRFVEMFYWVSCLVLAYYYSLITKNIKTPIVLLIAFLPLFLFVYVDVVNNNIGRTRFLLLNNVYYLFFLLPFVVTLKSAILKYAGILLIFIAVVISYKRTAILALSISLIYVLIVDLRSAKGKAFKIFYSVLFLVLVISAMFYFYNTLSQTYNLNWIERLEAISTDPDQLDGSSARVVIWQDIFQALKSQHIYYWFFGHGYLSTRFRSDVTGAHNDFLQILFDFGVLGLIVYLWFIVVLLKYYIRMIKSKYDFYPAFGVSLIIFFVSSMLSMLVILPYWFLYLPIFWGLIIPDFERYEKNEFKIGLIKTGGTNEGSVVN